MGWMTHFLSLMFKTNITTNYSFEYAFLKSMNSFFFIIFESNNKSTQRPKRVHVPDRGNT
jgi:hypothetical protein